MELIRYVMSVIEALRSLVSLAFLEGYTAGMDQREGHDSAWESSKSKRHTESLADRVKDILPEIEDILPKVEEE